MIDTLAVLSSLLRPKSDTIQLELTRFRTMSDGWMLSTLATAVGGEMCHWDWEILGAQTRKNSLSNSLGMDIYPAASARRHVLMPPSYKISMG